MDVDTKWFYHRKSIEINWHKSLIQTVYDVSKELIATSAKLSISLIFDVPFVLISNKQTNKQTKIKLIGLIP